MAKLTGQGTRKRVTPPLGWYDTSSKSPLSLSCCITDMSSYQRTDPSVAFVVARRMTPNIAGWIYPEQGTVTRSRTQMPGPVQSCNFGILDSVQSSRESCLSHDPANPDSAHHPPTLFTISSSSSTPRPGPSGTAICPSTTSSGSFRIGHSSRIEIGSILYSCEYGTIALAAQKCR